MITKSKRAFLLNGFTRYPSQWTGAFAVAGIFILCLRTMSLLLNERLLLVIKVGIIHLFLLPGILQAAKCPEEDLKIYTRQLQLCIQQHETTKSLVYSDSVIRVLPGLMKFDCKEALEFLTERGEALEINMRFAEALDVYYHVIRVSESEAWWSIAATAHISSARCFEFLGRSEDCLRHFEQAKKIIDRHKLWANYANYCLRYASFHRVLGNRDTALVYSKKSLEYGKKYNVPRSVFDGHLLLGLLETNTDTSIFHLNETIRMFNERKDFHGATSQSFNIVSRLLRTGRVEEAGKEIDRAGAFLNRMEKNTKAYFRMMSKWHEVRHQWFFQNGQLDSAYQQIQSAWEYDKRSQWDINQDSITTNAVNFAIEKEKQKNILLEKVSRRTKWGLLLTSILLLTFLGLMLNNHKKRKKIISQNQLIQQQNADLEQSNTKQALLLAEVHHRVKNNLQLVISLLTLHGKNAPSKETNQFLFDMTSKIRSISLIHEQLYSAGEFENIRVAGYLNQLAEHFQILQKAENRFEYHVAGEDVAFNLETIMPLGIICSELIANSLKYAIVPGKKLCIHIGVYDIDNKFVLKYSDNGPGIPDKEFNQSDTKMGLQLIKNMVRQLQAESRFYNDEGMHFNLVFSEKQVSQI